MKRCPSCGRENLDNVDFCVSCRQYLRWEPTRLSTAAIVTEDAPTVTESLPAVLREPEPQPEPEQRTAPDTAVIALRLPGDDESSGAVTARVEPGGRTAILALVRNQSGIVDNYDVTVDGIPDDWWSVSPATVYLVPFGKAEKGFEQDVEVQFHPPRTAEAEAREWPVTVVATSKTRAERVASTDATLLVAPYEELESELRPERARGRRRARFALAVRNRSNAPIDVAFSAVDAQNACRFEIEHPTATAQPGRRAGTVFWVHPPKQIWVGRSVEHRFTITPQAVASQSKGIPRPGVFVQRAWIPRWVPTSIPVAAAAAAAVLLLLPKQATVPSLIGAVGIEQATARLQQAGLAFGQAESVPTGKFKVGTVLRQSVPAGRRVKHGTPVSVLMAAASELGLVPNVTGLPLAAGEKALQKAGFVPGTVVPAPTDPNQAILSQSLPGGQRAHIGSVVNIFLPKPVTTSTTASVAGATTTAPSSAGGAPKLVIPSVVGLTGAAITAAIAKLGLTPVPVTQFSTSVPMGHVVSQTPPAGAPPPADGKVTIVVSGGFPDIAYDNGVDVVVAGGAAGKPVKPVANSSDIEAEPAWSPDGTLLAYLKGNGQQKQTQIVVADPTKPGSAHAVTSVGFFDHRPAFSPDGKVIAFVRTASTSDGDLCFVPADGSAPPSCKVDPTTSVDRPAWAPDGKAILVTATPTGSSSAQLYEYTSAQPSSSDPNTWQPQGFVSQSPVFQAAWSSDGKRVAYTANTGSAGYSVFIAAAANDVVGQPTALGVRGCDVTWRSDGLELAVVQADAGCTQLGRLVRLAVQNPQKATPVANKAADPAWSPVGR